MAVSKKRLTIWNKSKGFCWYCGCDIPLESRWHADHVEPVLRELKIVKNSAGGIYSHKAVCSGEMYKAENDTIDNMVPTCAPCNNFKFTFPLEDFRSELEAQIDRARKSSVNFRNCERFGLIEIKPAKVVFWFEKNISRTAEIDDLKRLERLR